MAGPPSEDLVETQRQCLDPCTAGGLPAGRQFPAMAPDIIRHRIHTHAPEFGTAPLLANRSLGVNPAETARVPESARDKAASKRTADEPTTNDQCQLIDRERIFEDRASGARARPARFCRGA